MINSVNMSIFVLFRRRFLNKLISKCRLLSFPGEDGPSQMALEDLSMFRSIPGSTVFYPSDAVSTERAVELAANTPGVCFIRTSRPNTPMIYSADDVLQIGKGRVSSCFIHYTTCTVYIHGKCSCSFCFYNLCHAHFEVIEKNP